MSSASIGGAPMAASPSTALSPVVGSPIFQHPFHTQSPGGFQHPYPTPSPFPSISASSGGGLSSKLVVRPYSDLLLRFLTFILAFVSAILLGASSFNFRDQPAFGL